MIGDPRNDENVIVSQIHLVFVRLHNKFLAQVRTDPTVREDRQFAEHLQSTTRRLPGDGHGGQGFLPCCSFGGCA
ncbi:MAG: hypothetical protein M3P34_01720 [Actinomycetota bacterium]|nr:hypothetical protein [Actinomycetota bacterium]